MLFTGFAVAIQGLQVRLDAGYGDPARAFVIVPISTVTMFAAFVTAAIVNLKRPEWHKRLMLVATVSLLQAAVARFFFLATTGGGPGYHKSVRTPLYPVDELDRWAGERLGMLVHSSSELADERR